MRFNHPPGKSPHVKKETSISFAGAMLAVLLFFTNLLIGAKRAAAAIGRDVVQAIVPPVDSAPRLAFAGGSPPGPVSTDRSKQSVMMGIDSRAGGYLPRATRHKAGHFGGGGYAFA